jgi:hypothetical protein
LQHGPNSGDGTFVADDDDDDDVGDELSSSTTKWKLCEFGCGPGLPSLTAAHTNHYSQVVATDLDEFCLELVQAAAKDQGLEHIVRTQVLDLTKDPKTLLGARMMDDDGDSESDASSPSPSPSNGWVADIDLFVMADIFENAEVAKGAAAWTKFLLNDNLQYDEVNQISPNTLGSNQNGGSLETHNSFSGEESHLNQDMTKPAPPKNHHRPRIWVFAQSDRAQREIYLETLKEICGKGAEDLKWLPLEECNDNDSLWLVDLDETQVQYG